MATDLEQLLADVKERLRAGKPSPYQASSFPKLCASQGDVEPLVEIVGHLLSLVEGKCTLLQDAYDGRANINVMAADKINTASSEIGRIVREAREKPHGK